MSRRRLLIGLTAVLLVGVVLFLVVRSGSEGGDAVATAANAGPTTTTASRASTTTPSTTTAPTTTAPTTTSGPTTASVPTPVFQSSVGPVSAEELGASWDPAVAGCTPPEGLRALTVSHWGYDGQVHEGRIIVEAAQAERVVAAFGDVYAARFPIERMVPISEYGGDDQASMRANNTSGYNCRTVAGSSKLSQHALGRAVDINPLVNPYVQGGTVDPPEGAPWADRSRGEPGMIKAGDAVVRAFARQGWGWGGAWSSGPDYQHLSASGR
jgi:hypothetical protein